MSAETAAVSITQIRFGISVGETAFGLSYGPGLTLAPEI